MKSDPEKVDSFFERLNLKPAAASSAKAPTEPVAPQRARRAPALVMRMDGWNISGNVVIIPDSGAATLDQVLAARPPSSQQRDS